MVEPKSRYVVEPKSRSFACTARMVDVVSEPAPESVPPVATEPGEQQRRGLDRLVFFSDAVVAIAITLVVLPLVDSAREVGEHSVGWFLAGNRGGLIAAGISFVVIATFWRSHHSLFGRATGYTRLLLRMNSAWLAGIVFLPLATVLDVIGTGSDGAGPVIYLATIAYTLAAGALEWLVLVRAGLLGSRLQPDMWEIVEQFSGAVLVLIAIVVVLVVPAVGLWPLLLLLLDRVIDPALRRIGAARRARRGGERPPLRA